MDVKQLLRFVTVADCRSFAQAARLLHVSQPALTRSIQMLEETVDAPLLERGPRGVALTPAGVELLPRAKAILNERDRALSAIATVKRDRTHRVTVGATPRLSSRVLCDPILAFCDANPEVEVRIVEGSLGELFVRLRENELDFCIASRADPAGLGDIVFEPLIDDIATIIARSAHPIHRRAALALADLCEERWVVLDSEDVRTQWRAMFLRRELPVPRSVIWSQSWDMAQSMLLRGDYVMISALHAVGWLLETGRIAEVRTDPEPFRVVTGLFTPAHRTPSRLAASLTATVRRHWAPAPAPKS